MHPVKFIGSARAEDATRIDRKDRARRNHQRAVRAKLRTARWKAGSTWR